MGLLNFLNRVEESVEDKAPTMQKANVTYKGTVERAGIVTNADETLVNMVYYGWMYRESKNAVEEQLKEVNTQLLNSVGVGAKVTIDGVCTATLTERTTVEVSDPDRLMGILGAQRFSDLVEETVRLICSKKLIELAHDADNPLSKLVASCLTFKTSESVTYKTLLPTEK